MSWAIPSGRLLSDGFQKLPPSQFLQSVARPLFPAQGKGDQLFLQLSVVTGKKPAAFGVTIAAAFTFRSFDFGFNPTNKTRTKFEYNFQHKGGFRTMELRSLTGDGFPQYARVRATGSSGREAYLRRPVAGLK